MPHTNPLGERHSTEVTNDFDDETLEKMSWDAVELVNEKIQGTENYLMPIQIYEGEECRAFDKNDLGLRACYGESNLSRKVFKISDVVKGKAIPKRESRHSKELLKFMHVFIGSTLVDGKLTDFEMVDFFEISQHEHATAEFCGVFSVVRRDIISWYCNTKVPIEWESPPSDIDD